MSCNIVVEPTLKVIQTNVFDERCFFAISMNCEYHKMKYFLTVRFTLASIAPFHHTTKILDTYGPGEIELDISRFELRGFLKV